MDESLILKDFRCFSRRQEIRVAPLTLAMGDNSSGKSSFLAAYRAATSIARGYLSNDFNEAPFSLGAYDQIAHVHGGKTGRARSFSLGLAYDLPKSTTATLLASGDRCQIEAQYAEHEAQPRISAASIRLSNLSIRLVFTDDWSSADIRVSIDGRETQYKLPENYAPISGMGLLSLEHLLFAGLYQSPESENRHPRFRDIFRAIEFIFSEFKDGHSIRNPVAFSPVRTHPKRTYDSVNISERPEGDHVPLILSRTYQKKDKAEWRSLKDALEKFGQASGLFKHIEIKRFGQKHSDPFQIKVVINGPSSNLIDVGYGVSQSLPLIVDIVRAPKSSRFLIQQPEVHLHPKAQAELGSYLASLCFSEKKRFIIETHSDFLLDRIRREVRLGRFVKKDDVAILYFERKKAEVTVTNIQLDDLGNVIQAPKGYRRFFLDEEQKNLGVFD